MLKSPMRAAGDPKPCNRHDQLTPTTGLQSPPYMQSVNSVSYACPLPFISHHGAPQHLGLQPSQCRLMGEAAPSDVASAMTQPSHSPACTHRRDVITLTPIGTMSTRSQLCSAAPSSTPASRPATVIPAAFPGCQKAIPQNEPKGCL